MDLPAIKQLAFELMGTKRSHPWKESGNKYYHGERVARLIITLRKQILPQDVSHDNILTVAAWFHDIMNGYSEDHGTAGADKVKSILENQCPATELSEICHIISLHDKRDATVRYTLPAYIKLHQDADYLDHFGTYDIWIKMMYAAHREESVTDVATWFTTAWRDDWDRHRSELHYDISKRIYDEKQTFVRNFGDRMAVEGNGGIWDETSFFKNT